MDYYLKAASEAALMTALEAAGVVKSYTVKNEQGVVVDTRFVTEPGYSLDVVGTIYKPTGNMIQQTGEFAREVPEMVALPGFHANLRGPASLAPTVVLDTGSVTTEEPNNSLELETELNTVTPSPIEQLLVYPQSPSRVWF